MEPRVAPQCPPRDGVADSIDSISNAGKCLSVGSFRRVGSECPASCREHDDNCADPDPIVEVDDILIGHADAARRDGSADIFGLVGAVNTVPCVLAT